MAIMTSDMIVKNAPMPMLRMAKPATPGVRWVMNGPFPIGDGSRDGDRTFSDSRSVPGSNNLVRDFPSEAALHFAMPEQDMSHTPDPPAGSTTLTVRPRTAPPRVRQLPPWRVLLHNDDVNETNFVIATI